MKTSIIILTYNQLQLTKTCLESIEKHTPADDIEIIFVDNGSSDGTVDYLKNLPYITIFNEKNLGFAKGCNQGYEASSGENILFLNNDTVVTPNWLSTMLGLLYSEEDIAIVGPMSNYASGPQQIPVSYTQLCDLDAFAGEYTHAYSGKSKRVYRLVGFCLLIRRSVVEEIGAFDEGFGIGSFEDDDLCLRAIQKGYQLRIAQDAFIHHEGHATFTANSELNIYTSFHQNRHRLIEKWKIDPSHLYSRSEIVQLIPPNAKKILDVGCAAGATGIEIRNRQDCEIYGIENNPHLAQIAKGSYSHIAVEDAGTWAPEYPESFFDVIIFSNVLEHLQDPWSAVEKLCAHLAPGGSIICCIPNILHAEALLPLLQGDFSYVDAGILSRDHLRFFTEKTALQLFPEPGFRIDSFVRIEATNSKDIDLFLSEVTHIAKKFNLHLNHLQQNARTYQFLIRAVKN